MSITNTRLTPQGVQVQITEADFVPRYRARYIVDCDQQHGPVYVLNNVAGVSGANDPVPAKWDTYDVDGEADSSAYALEFQLAIDPEKRSRWYLDVTWRRPVPGEDPQQNVANPLFRPPVYWFEAARDTETVEKARNVDAFNHLTPARPAGTLGGVVNTAGNDFDVTWDRPISRPALMMRRWYAAIGAARAALEVYGGKLNSDAWQGAQPGELLVDDIRTSEPVQEFGGTYYQVLFSILYRPGGWIKEFVNRGFGYLDGSGNYVAFTDGSGNPVAEPRLLNATGGELGDGNPGTDAIVRYWYGDEVAFGSSVTSGSGVSGDLQFDSIDSVPFLIV